MVTQPDGADEEEEKTGCLNRRHVLYVTGGISIGAITTVRGQSTDPDSEGTEADPYQLSTVDDLQAIAEEPDAHYELTSDIDASATATWDNNAGFQPIGDTDTPFTGSLNGNHHTIRGLTINRPESTETGLFGVTADATIQNLHLRDADITGHSRTGGIAGDSDSMIVRSSTSGVVTGAEYVGGVVGKNRGLVEECSSASDVAGTIRVGGAVGGNQIGSEINNSYATGAVTGTEAVGGLFGGNQFATVIRRSYAIGRVTGDTDTGGLVGSVRREESSSIIDSYWNVETTTQEFSAGHDASDGLRTPAMTGSAARDNMDGFDFQTVWETTETYPIFQWQDRVPEAADGSDIEATDTTEGTDGTEGGGGTEETGETDGGGGTDGSKGESGTDGDGGTSTGTEDPGSSEGTADAGGAGGTAGTGQDLFAGVGLKAIVAGGAVTAGLAYLAVQMLQGEDEADR